MAHPAHPKPAAPIKPGPGDGYEVGEAIPTGPRSDLKLIERPGRWCPACGCDLTLIDEPPCPRCERPFVPGDPSTTSAEPVEVRHPYWTDKQRIAGYVMLPLFLLGRGLINYVAPGWGSAATGGTGGTQAAQMASMVLAVFTALLIIPWLVTTVLLGLVALGDYYNPRAVYCLMIGMGLGLFLSLGLAPPLLLVGAIAGLFAGFVRAWLAKV